MLTIIMNINSIRLVKIRFLVSYLLIMLTSCHSDVNSLKIKTITVEKKALIKDLFFSGTIRPIKVVNIASPVEGTVAQKHFEFGQSVQANQALITLASHKLAEDYQTALVNYLKIKTAYMSAKEKFIGTEELMKYQLIAKDNYHFEQQALANAYLDYLQAKYKLKELSNDHKLPAEKLSLADVKKAAAAIRQPQRMQAITAPSAGIALAAPKSASNDHEEQGNHQLLIGDQVKAGQIVLTLGDLSGIAVDIQVPEIDIGKIKLDTPVTITGPAFPGINLNGKITAIAAQAKPATNSTGGLPTFGVEISVPQLTAKQRKHIYVGMSAKINIHAQEGAVITIPIQAVYQKQDKAYVKLLVDNKVQERMVTPGKTTLSDIVIEDGLKPGERVIVND